jgi:MFS transporter, DHA3 family, macrolide efflux protein
MSIVPELVHADLVGSGVRMSQSLLAIGRVMGGVVGGALVTWVGVGAAFAVDAASFFVAAAATAAITRTLARSAAPAGAPAPAFFAQLRAGFLVIHRVPVLLWLCVAIAFFNVILAPMEVILPTYAKLAKGMPAWFLGGLEASMGLGVLVGAVSIGLIERILRLVSSVIIGLVLIGLGIALLPYLPGVVSPMMVMFVIGLGAAWTNIPISTRISVAVPDAFRSRVNSIVAFLFDGTAPVGLAIAGALIPVAGVGAVMTWFGTIVLISVPIFYTLPGFADFFRRPPEELTDHFLKAHPGAFAND